MGYIMGSDSANTAALSAFSTSSDWTNDLAEAHLLAGASAFGEGSASLRTGLSCPDLLSSNRLAPSDARGQPQRGLRLS